MTDKSTPLFYPNERIGIFADGANTYGAAKALQFAIDYKAMLEYFALKGVLVRAYYYTIVTDPSQFNPLHPLIDYLEYNGWTVVAKHGEEYTNSAGTVRARGSITGELVADAMDVADRLDHVILFSGDGDYCRMVELLQRRGKRVSIVSTIKSVPAVCSDDLRRQADNFIEMDDLRLAIARPERAVAPGKIPA